MSTHRHKYRHIHAHSHQHRPKRGSVPYAALVSRISSQGIAACINDLDSDLRDSRLKQLLFSGLPPRFRTVEESEVAQIELEDLLDPVLVITRAARRCGIDTARARRYVKFLSGHQLPLAFPEMAADVRRTSDYGRLLGDTRSVAESLGFGSSLPQFESFRRSLAAATLPIGIGWTSTYEYRHWLVHYVLLEPKHPVSGGDKLNYRVFQIKEDWIARLGPKAHQVFRLADIVTAEQLHKWNSLGIRCKLPRSSRRLASVHHVEHDVACETISLLAQLPATPLHDCLDALSTAGRSLNRDPRAELRVIRKGEGVSLEWQPQLARLKKWIEDPHIVQRMETARLLATCKLPDANVKEQIRHLTQMLDSNTALSQAECIEYADALLSSAGDDELVAQSLEFHDELPDKKLRKYNSPGTLWLSQQRLKRMVVRYDQARLKFRYHYLLARAVLDQQIAYIDSGKLSDLKPLTKARIVMDLGYIPSCQPARNPRERKLRNMGRRLERYMDAIWLQMPDGSVRNLSLLITGPGGVHDVTGRHVSTYEVQDHIRNLILHEDGKPLSDRMISSLLHQRYGIFISREAVCKYRRKMGYPSSQARGTRRETACSDDQADMPRT